MTSPDFLSQCLFELLFANCSLDFLHKCSLKFWQTYSWTVRASKSVSQSPKKPKTPPNIPESPTRGLYKTLEIPWKSIKVLTTCSQTVRRLIRELVDYANMKIVRVYLGEHLFANYSPTVGNHSPSSSHTQKAKSDPCPQPFQKWGTPTSTVGSNTSKLDPEFLRSCTSVTAWTKLSAFWVLNLATTSVCWMNRTYKSQSLCLVSNRSQHSTV